MLRQQALASVCAMMLWVGGCPKRQELQSVVVYVPAPPPAASAAPTPKTQPVNPQYLVIEEPLPPVPPEPEPDENPPAQNPPAVVHHRRNPAHPAPPAETAEPEEPATPTETPVTPPAEVPALEPRQSSAQETELRQ